MRSRSRIEERLHVVLDKPRLHVTSANYKYLQVLDILENKGRFYLNDEDLHQKVNRFIIDNHMDFGKLVGLASKGYPNIFLTLAVETRV